MQQQAYANASTVHLFHPTLYYYPIHSPIVLKTERTKIAEKPASRTIPIPNSKSHHSTELNYETLLQKRHTPISITEIQSFLFPF